MAVTQTTVTGPIYIPNLTKPENAKIVFELSSWDREEGEATFVTGPFVGAIDENGDFSVNLFTTTEGTNQAVYHVSVTYLTMTGQYTRECIGTVALSGPGPYNLADLDFIDPNTTASFDLLAEVRAKNLNMDSVLAASNTNLIHAKEWAVNNENVPVSLAAGGGVTSFSAKHWAMKAETNYLNTITSKKPSTYGPLGTNVLDVAAMTALIADLEDGDTIDMTGNFDLSGADLSINGYSNLRVYSSGGKITYDRTDTHGLEFVFCPNAKICGLSFTSNETLATWIAYDAAERLNFRPALNVSHCDHVTVCGIRTNDGSVRNAVQLVNCKNPNVFDNHHSGFLPDVVGIPETAEDRGAWSIFIKDCNEGGSVWGNQADHAASGILVGSLSEEMSFFGNTGRHLHDNGIYLSSAEHCSCFGNTYTDVSGTGIKMAGNNNVATGNSLRRCNAGIVVRGLYVLDVEGSCGHGSVVSGNTFQDCQSGVYGTLTSQDGGISSGTRDLSITGNVLINCTSTGTAPIQVFCTSGLSVMNNIIRGFASPQAMSLNKTTAGDLEDVNVSHNTIKGGLDWISANGVVRGIFDSNKLSELTGGIVNGVFADCDKIKITNTMTDDVTMRPDFRPSPAGLIECYSNEFNCIYLPLGSPNKDNASDLNYNVTVTVPKKIGQRTLSAGNFYLAIGVASISDWKLIT